MAHNIHAAEYEPLLRLTPAERAVASYVLVGLTNREIAEQLRKRVTTVKAQVASILRKCGVPSRSRFIVFCTQILPVHRSDLVKTAVGARGKNAGGGSFPREDLPGSNQAALN